MQRFYNGRWWNDDKGGDKQDFNNLLIFLMNCTWDCRPSCPLAGTRYQYPLATFSRCAVKLLGINKYGGDRIGNFRSLNIFNAELKVLVTVLVSRLQAVLTCLIIPGQIRDSMAITIQFRAVQSFQPGWSRTFEAVVETNQVMVGDFHVVQIYTSCFTLSFVMRWEWTRSSAESGKMAKPNRPIL